MEKMLDCLWGFLLLCFSYSCRVPEAGIKTILPQHVIQPGSEAVDNSWMVVVPTSMSAPIDTIKQKTPVPEPKMPVKKLPKTISSVYLSQLSVREATGHNDGKEVEKYLHSVGLDKGYPWCAAFVRWCYDSTGIKTTINGAAASAHNPKNLVYFKNKQLQEPQPGDAFTLWYTSLNRIGHTGFFHQKINESVYQTCEANTNEAGSREGDGVYQKYRSFHATYSISRWTKS
jgi:hypothetical protein